MATKFRLIKPEFVLDLSEAAKKCGKMFGDLIPIVGFLNDWQNPSAIVVSQDDDFWLINMSEVRVHYQSAEPHNAEDIENNSLHVWFIPTSSQNTPGMNPHTYV